MTASNLPPGCTVEDVSGPNERGTYRVTLKCTLDVSANDAGEAREIAEQQLPPDAENVNSEAELTTN